MDEVVCRVSAELRKSGEITIDVDGYVADVIACIGGLARSAADFAEVSVEELVKEVASSAMEQTMKEWRELESVVSTAK